MVKLRDKMLLIYGSIIFMSILVSSVILFSGTRHIGIQGSIYRARENNARIGNALETYLRMLNRMALQISVDETVQRAMKKTYTASESSLYEQRKDNEALFFRMESFRSLAPNASGIFLLRTDGFYYYDYSRFLTQESIASNMDRIIRNVPGGGHYFFLFGPYETAYHNIPSRRAVSILRQIPDLEIVANYHRHQCVGFIAIEIEINNLINEIITVADLSSHSGFIIVSSDREIIYSNQEGHEERLDADLYEKITATKDSIFVSYRGENSLFTSSVSGLSGWTIINFISERELNRSIRNIGFFLITAGIFCMILAMVATILFSRRIVSPLQKITGMLSRIEQGNFGETVHLDTNDELMLLAEGYNSMSRRLSGLLDDIYRTGEQERQAEIAALQSRINPHFIYNTLDTIKQMAVMQRTKGIKDMANSLILLLRSQARHEGAAITIDEELSLLRAYIYIQETRYTGKFIIHWHVDEKLLPCQTIGLILQPIVENAIFHGIVPGQGIGVIEISIYEKEGCVVYLVRDDGVGMDEEKRRRFFDNAGEEDFRKLGLINVDRRLRLCYGDDYGITLEGRSGKGMSVIVVFPKCFP
jgi:two-component system sensor histidine kinase YesM